MAVAFVIAMLVIQFTTIVLVVTRPTPTKNTIEKVGMVFISFGIVHFFAMLAVGGFLLHHPGLIIFCGSMAIINGWSASRINNNVTGSSPA